MESNKKIVPRLLAGACVLSLLGAVLFSGKTYGKEQNASTDAVEALLSEMTLEEKVYQMFIVTPEQLTGASKVTAAGNLTKQKLKEKNMIKFLLLTY